MSENVWQIDMFGDLFKFLRNNAYKYIILSLVLSNTEQEIKSMIKKFIKRKAEKFSNVVFLFYCVKKEDMGKISFIPNDVSVYPKMCHIQNWANEVVIDVTSIDCIEILNESFSEAEHKYIEDLNKISDKSSGSVITNNLHQQSFAQKQMDELKNIQAEQQKMFKKILYLKQKANENSLEFIEDCRKRKKEEEKQKKKAK